MTSSITRALKWIPGIREEDRALLPNEDKPNENKTNPKKQGHREETMPERSEIVSLPRCMMKMEQRAPLENSCHSCLGRLWQTISPRDKGVQDDICITPKKKKKKKKRIIFTNEASNRNQDIAVETP